MNKISVSLIKDKTLPAIKQKGRKLNYYLILNLIFPHLYDSHVLEHLKAYQNLDGGFGNALEPDVQAPDSSVVATDLAIDILSHINPCREKRTMMKHMVGFLETKFDPQTQNFEFAPDSIQNYPHAVWWNDPSNFGFFNPTPEVAGFLYQNKEFLNTIDIDLLVQTMVSKILSESFEKTQAEHSIYSVLKFYRKVDKENQEKIKSVLEKKIDETICTDSEKWDEYGPQPYKFFPFPASLKAKDYQEIIQENFNFLFQKMDEHRIWMPEWQWMQYDEIFESVAKNQWAGYVTYERLRAFQAFGLLDLES